MTEPKTNNIPGWLGAIAAVGGVGVALIGGYVFVAMMAYSDMAKDVADAKTDITKRINHLSSQIASSPSPQVIFQTTGTRGYIITVTAQQALPEDVPQDYKQNFCAEIKVALSAVFAPNGNLIGNTLVGEESANYQKQKAYVCDVGPNKSYVLIPVKAAAPTAG